MSDDLEPDDQTPSLEFAALVVIVCILGAVAVIAVSALWRAFA